MLFFLVTLLYFRVQKQSIPTHVILELDHILQHTIDSLKLNEQPKTIYPFNPNFIIDQRWYFFGLRPQEIDPFHAYRKQGKWINSVREVQKVTGVYSIWLNVYRSFLTFQSEQKKERKPLKKRYLPHLT